MGLFTGPVGRAKLISKIIRAGKHVMTTKPFEQDPQAALDVLCEARELKRIVHLNSPSPVFSDDLLRIEQWRETLGLGRPIGCRADVWVRYHEKPTGVWYDDPELCYVAPVLRLGIYLINDLIRLIGPVAEVQVVQSRLFTERPTVDNAQLGMLFENGAIANIFASFCVNDRDHYKNSLTLNFENGTVYRDAGPVSRQPEGGFGSLSVVSARTDGTRYVEHAQAASASGGYQWDVFHRAILGQEIPNQVTPEQIANGIRVLAAMHAASKSRATEKV